VRRAAFAVLTALLLVVQAPTASARDALVNAAVASVTQDGDVEVRFAWEVRRTNGPNVAARNVAIATASCRSCRSAALAFQIVLASRFSGDLRADNLALARSDGCTQCETLAIAYQFVVATEGRLQLAPGARAELAHIRNQLRHLAREQAATNVLEARADLLAAKIRDILAQQLTTRHIPGHTYMRRHVLGEPGAVAVPHRTSPSWCPSQGHRRTLAATPTDCG
jgi:hypothetical protein